MRGSIWREHLPSGGISFPAWHVLGHLAQTGGQQKMGMCGARNQELKLRSPPGAWQLPQGKETKHTASFSILSLK